MKLPAGNTKPVNVGASTLHEPAFENFPVCPDKTASRGISSLFNMKLDTLRTSYYI